MACLILLPVAVGSCGDGGTCRPGETDDCTCEDGQQSTKVCSDDGKWGACECYCERDCTGRDCGDDGCGGSCGECTEVEECRSGICECIFESCQGQCCSAAENCYQGRCCLPYCGGKLCGSDGCGGECPPGCSADEVCDPNTWTCSSCVPDCEGKECGPDGCGGECQPGCESGFLCHDGLCEACVPDCTDRECGFDGCGGQCPPGCAAGLWCDQTGACVDPGQRNWVTVPAGTFTMGSPQEEPGRFDNEVLHEVTISRDFEMLSTEVLFGDFEALMGYAPPKDDCGAECPVAGITWHEAAAYTNALSAAEGLESCYECAGSGADVVCELAMSLDTPYDCLGYRLPTEAEWEYAARAGTDTATYNGDVDEDHLRCEVPNQVLEPIAWYCGNASFDIHPAALKEPNPLGLFDMLGSEWEWCQDWYSDFSDEPATDPWGPASGTEKVRRGGSYLDMAWDARAARRRKLGPEWAGTNDGVRPVRTLP